MILMDQFGVGFASETGITARHDDFGPSAGADLIMRAHDERRAHYGAFGGFVGEPGDGWVARMSRCGQRAERFALRMSEIRA